jgi:hypothetical protein
MSFGSRADFFHGLPKVTRTVPNLSGGGRSLVLFRSPFQIILLTNTPLLLLTSAASLCEDGLGRAQTRIY